MLQRAAGLVPASIPSADAWAKVFGLQDPASARLLGLASEHVSHLHELGLPECAGTARLLEFLGTAVVRLAVAHSVHLSPGVVTAADASNRTATALPGVYKHLASRLDLTGSMRLGKSVRGAVEQPSTRVVQSVIAQAIGAYTFCVGYGNVRKLLPKMFTPPQQNPARPQDCKTALLGYAQSIGFQPQYAVLSEAGPDHPKTFTVKVWTDNKHEAQGEGPTKKAAAQAAAERYLQRYAPVVGRPHPAAARPRPHPHAVSVPSKPRHLRLRNLVHQVGIKPEQDGLLDTALTHPSYRVDHPGTPDNTVLAHLGSIVLDAIVSYRFTYIVLDASLCEAVDGRMIVPAIVGKTKRHLETASGILNLKALLHAGKALQDVNTPIKVETFQAVMGASILGRPCPSLITDFLPKGLRQWLDKAILQEAPAIKEALEKAKRAVQQKKATSVRKEPSSPAAGPAPLPGNRMIRCKKCGDNVWPEAMPRHLEHCRGSQNTLAGVPVRQLPFTLLPPGTWNIQQVVEHYRDARKKHGSGWGERELEPSRILDIATLHPADCYVGKESWKWYVVFTFAKTDRVVLECPFKGNATYILTGNWKDMIHQTKAELRDEYQRRYTRVIHRGDWLRKIRRALH